MESGTHKPKYIILMHLRPPHGLHFGMPKSGVAKALGGAIDKLVGSPDNRHVGAAAC